jgi:hypothetical protein
MLRPRDAGRRGEHVGRVGPGGSRVFAEEGCVRPGPVSRRQALAILGGAGALAAEGLLLTADTAATIAVGRPAVTNYLLFVDPQGVAGRNMV